MKHLSYIAIVAVTVAIFFVSATELVQITGQNRSIQIEYVNITDPEIILKEDFDCSRVKPIVYTRVPNLSSLPLSKRKEAFIRILLPSILIAQENIINLRNKVIKLKEKLDKKYQLTDQEYIFLSNLFNKYKTQKLDELLRRLNTHPVSIILAQAALESGWGTSRFFVEANNVFGIWTFKKGSGVKAVSSEARLARFSSILEAVQEYLFNINVGWAYEGFRIKRIDSEKPLVLINYLEKYSILRKEYVNRLNNLIRSNHLEKYDSCSLDPSFNS